MHDRVSSILAELGARHGSDQAFLESLRPTVAKIVDPTLPDEVRVHLMELLADTCERERLIRQNTEQVQAHWQEFFSRLANLIRRLDRPPAA
ncbi:MAG: hypothetical protein IT458_15945 [Planctomycetes bacterium]|nr:hypothetical protein [Planctomycetota bacterium]